MLAMLNQIESFIDNHLQYFEACEQIDKTLLTKEWKEIKTPLRQENLKEDKKQKEKDKRDKLQKR